MKKIYLTDEQVRDAEREGVIQWMNKDATGYFLIQQEFAGESVACASIQSMEITRRLMQERGEKAWAGWGSIQKEGENRFDHRGFFERNWK